MHTNWLVLILELSTGYLLTSWTALSVFVKFFVAKTKLLHPAGAGLVQVYYRVVQIQVRTLNKIAFQQNHSS